MVRTILGRDVYATWAAQTQMEGRDWSRGNVFFEGGVIYSYGHHFPLAMHREWGFLVNGDTYSVTTSGHQSNVRAAIQETGRRAATLPFSALQRMGVSAFDVRPVDTETDREIVTTCRHDYCENKVHRAHLLGRSVIRSGTHYYLSGTDETMRNPWGGYFLSELPGYANTVEEALEILKPPAVLAAEAGGIECVRQGEWFFIPHSTKPPVSAVQKHRALPNRDRTRRPRHVATFVAMNANGTILVKGTVRHNQQEHKMLRLGNVWHSAWENTEIRSVRSGGRVD